MTTLQQNGNVCRSVSKMAASNVSSAENITGTPNVPEKDGSLQTFSKDFGEVADSDKLEIDLAVKCRGCFVEDPEMHYLFTVFDQKLSLADILMQTTSFVCKEDDGFPPYLCTKCTTCLIDFFNFKIQFQKTDMYVQTLLDKLNLESLEAVNIKAEVESDQGSNYEEIVDEEPGHEEVQSSRYVERFVPDLTKIEDQSVYCDICQIEFLDCDTQITHMAKEHGKNPFTKFKFFKKMILEQEKAAIQAKKKTKQMEEDLREQMLLEMPGKLCRICRKKFPEEEFKTHWEIHKTNFCNQCAYKCVKKSDLELHVQAVHGNERNFTCHLCSRSFKTKPLLKRHQVVHLNPRRYCCDLCGQRFNDIGTLKTHVHLKHGGSRDFICPICGLAFPMKATLDKHIIRHNKNRPATFYCELCPATFRDKSSMKRHHLVKHTNEYQKPMCEFCGKSYCSKTKLRMHVERHHMGRVYERKKTCPRKFEKTEEYTSESEESEESSGSYEGKRRRGPRVMNVSEDFYRDDDSYPAEGAEVEAEYFEYKNEELDERDSECSEAESEYE